MRRVVVGLVCEGATDYVIFEHLLSGIAKDLDTTVAFKRFHPTTDATSGKIDSGGWLNVFRWCTRNGPDIRRNLFETASLFETDEEACDFLLVHLDTDICETLAASTLEVASNIAVSDFDFSQPAGRAGYIKAVIRFWLKLGHELITE